MSQIIKSITEFEKLLYSNWDSGFNIFFGAGISRDPPTKGPIWNEIQTGFLYALFDRMEAENWPAASYFEEDRLVAKDLNIRPEIFWSRMIEFCDMQVVWRVLEVADVGPPNANHDSIATLLASGRCKIAMTTNFDEHIESLLPDYVPVYVSTYEEDYLFKNSKKSMYIKLHGTISNVFSLSFTLEQYNKLIDRNTDLLQLFLGKPLLIMGYSGYDKDVLPALKKLVNSIPCIVIVRHLGSSSNQPVFDLASEGSTVYILEAPCIDVLSILTRGDSKCVFQNINPRRNESRPKIYQDAANMIPMQYCPFILMISFWTVGNWRLVHRYGWLTHDACCDDRYKDQLDPERYLDIHLNIAYSLKLSGDEVGARIMLEKAKASEEAENKLSGAMKIHWMDAFSHNAPTQDVQVSSPLKSKYNSSDILAGIVLLHELFVKSSNFADRDRFIAYWQLGVAKHRDGKLEEAIDAFNKGSTFIVKGISTHLETGRFLLDYAGALFEYCIKVMSDESGEQAYILYQLSERITREIEDWMTNARANLMLGKLFLTVKDFERARACVDKALESVSKSQDSALKSRIEEFSKYLKQYSKK